MEPSSNTTKAAPKAAFVVFTVYCHTHIESGRRYVGLTSRTMERRWSQHIIQARSSKGGRWHFPNAIRKYGPDAFSHKIIRVFDNLDDANLAEKCLIKRWKTRNPKFGFNVAPGGYHVPHPVTNPWDRPGFRDNYPKDQIRHCFTPAARAAQKASLTPEKRSVATKVAMARPDVQAKRKALQEDPEYRGRISSSLKASLSSPEARERMSDNSKKSSTPEVVAKRSQAIRTAYQDPEVQERHRAAVREAQNRPEVRAKHASKVVSQETRARISAASTGFRHTDESKADMKRQFAERRDRLLAESGCATWSDYIKTKI